MLFNLNIIGIDRGPLLADTVTIDWGAGSSASNNVSRPDALQILERGISVPKTAFEVAT